MQKPTSKPFRVIISENCTWQKCVALFLQSKLGLLTIDDPFLVKNSDEVLDFVSPRFHQSMYAFSIDVKDLYYSIPHDLLLSCIEECIDNFGCIAFQNNVGVSAGVSWNFYPVICERHLSSGMESPTSKRRGFA